MSGSTMSGAISSEVLWDICFELQLHTRLGTLAGHCCLCGLVSIYAVDADASTNMPKTCNQV